MIDQETLGDKKEEVRKRTEQEALDCWLMRMEFIVVALITLCTLLFVLAQGAWVIWKWQHEKLQITLSILNENWKVGLLLLVPLFYRTIRTFLEEVGEFMGMKRSQKGQGGEPIVEANPPKQK